MKTKNIMQIGLYLILILLLCNTSIAQNHSQQIKVGETPTGLTPGEWDSIRQQVYIKASTVEIGAYFGASVAISGNTVVVGTFETDRVYIFTQTAGVWSQQAELQPPEAVGNSGGYGHSIAIDGDTLVVGSYLESTIQGVVYVYIRSQGVWSEQEHFQGSNTEYLDTFGYAVAIYGDTIVVGAYGEDSNATGVGGDETNDSASQAGAAYVFTRTGTSWSQDAYLKASNSQTRQRFGWSLSIFDGTIVVGSINGAYVFTKNNDIWSQEDYLIIETGGNFGYSVAIFQDTIVVGEFFYDTGNSDIGAAYVYTRSLSSWNQQAILTATYTGDNDRFGGTVAIMHDTIVVGANYEASDAIDINGNESSNSALYAGAAYVFQRSGNIWSQQAYLKASNTDAQDHFGYSVAIADNIIAIGAITEKSNATGINGDQTNNSTNTAGAVYAFELFTDLIYANSYENMAEFKLFNYLDSKKKP